jgi:flagellar hook-associated protein 1 FlgK
MSANMPQSFAGIGQIGTGVVVSGVTRITDDYVNMQMQNEEASLARYERKSETLGQLEAMFNEPSTTGISHQMSEFFASWNNLASNPELDSAKTMVVRQSETFLDTINHTANKMQSLTENTVDQIAADVLDFNSAASQLKNINDQIFNATVKGEKPNDLFDKQDQLIGQLKNIAGIEVSKDSYGRAAVTLGSQEVVSENTAAELVAGSTGEISLNGEAVDIETGSIKGSQEALNYITDIQGEINGFVHTLADEVNTIHAAGGEDFFTYDADNVAGSISVNEALVEDPTLVETGNSDLAGDGSRAKAIADLQTNTNLTDDYNAIITDIGIEKQQSDNMVANQTDLTALLTQRQASISGVDINEEVVNMIQYSSAFQANSRAISTIAEMLDTLINRTGV